MDTTGIPLLRSYAICNTCSKAFGRLPDPDTSGCLPVATFVFALFGAFVSVIHATIRGSWTMHLCWIAVMAIPFCAVACFRLAVSFSIFRKFRKTLLLKRLLSGQNDVMIALLRTDIQSAIKTNLPNSIARIAFIRVVSLRTLPS